MTKGGRGSRSPARNASWYKQKRPGGGALARSEGPESSRSYPEGTPYRALIRRSSSGVDEHGMTPGAKIGRGPAPDAGSSAETGACGFEAEELPELTGAEESEDIFRGENLKDLRKANREGNETPKVNSEEDTREMKRGEAPRR